MDIVTKTADKGGVTRNVRTRGPDMTSAERQRRYKSRMAGEGHVQLNIWVPAHAVADFQRAAELVRENPDLTVARLVSARTGKLRGLRS